jgi:hypothetical protein
VKIFIDLPIIHISEIFFLTAFASWEKCKAGAFIFPAAARAAGQSSEGSKAVSPPVKFETLFPEKAIGHSTGSLKIAFDKKMDKRV